MKKLNLILCFLIITASGLAQGTKKITDESVGYTEKYSVLKSDNKIRQGPYVMSNTYAGDTIATGFYKNNMRDSVWRTYDSDKMLLAEGSFKNGQRVGEWRLYFKGNLVNRYDFTTNTLLFHKKFKSDSGMRRVITATDTVFTNLDHNPIYLNGGDWMYGTIAQIVRTPFTARIRQIKGTVIIGFTIDEKGHMRNIHLTKGLGYGCDEEAMRVVKVITDDWIPGMLNGKPVSVLTAIQVTFNAK